jgi:hypothetical protein
MKLTKKIKRRKIKSKKKIGGQRPSMGSNMRRDMVSNMGQNMNSKTLSNIGQNITRDMVSNMNSKTLSNMGQEFMQNQGAELINNLIMPVYNDVVSTGIDTAKKIALKEYNTKVEQLGLLNEAARKMLGTSERLQQTAKQTGKMFENVIDQMDPAYQMLQKGGEKLIKRINKSKNEFIEKTYIEKNV